MARAAQVYTFALCRAILMGCRKQLIEDERLFIGMVGIQPKDITMSDADLEKECMRIYNLELEQEIVWYIEYNCSKP